MDNLTWEEISKLIAEDLKWEAEQMQKEILEEWQYELETRTERQGI